MKGTPRARREAAVNVAALVSVLVSAVAAVRWNRMYGLVVWSVGWAAVIIVAVVIIVATAVLESVRQRCSTCPRAV